MPLYRITVILNKGKGAKVLRHYNEDFDSVYTSIFAASFNKYGNNMVEFDLVMLCRLSVEYQDFIKKNGFRPQPLKPPPPPPPAYKERAQGPGKYRNKL